jgi:hypothetical protein
MSLTESRLTRAVRLAGGAARQVALNAALAIGLWGSVQGASAQEVAADGARFSVDAARQVALNALTAGDAETALIFANGVLLAHPEDMAALLIQAQALRALGRKDAALDASQEAWAAAEEPKERYYAAMTQAQMRAYNGHNSIAQYWLRRAAEIAPDEQLKARAVMDFRHVRSITPWKFRLDLYAQPSDNINNASYEDTVLSFGTLSQEAYRGVRYGATAEARYVQSLSGTARLHYVGFVGGSVVRLDDAAKDAGGEDGNYSNGQLGAAIAYERKSADGNRIGRLQYTVSRQWQGGEPLADRNRLDLGVDQGLGQGMVLGLRLGLEDLDRLDSPLGDSQTRDLGLRLSRHVGFGTLALDVSTSETLSAGAMIGRTERAAGLSFSLAKPVAGMLPQLSARYTEFDYEDPGLFSTNGELRRDTRWRYGLDVVLPGLDYYGFAPEIGVSFTDRNSNYSLYKNRSTDVSLGLKSVF